MSNIIHKLGTVALRARLAPRDLVFGIGIGVLALAGMTVYAGYLLLTRAHLPIALPF